MAIKHKKVSGQPNVDSAHVGGADWDDNHHYTAGTPFVAGRFSAFYDTTTLTKTQSPAFLFFTKQQAGWYKLTIDPAALPVATGATLRFSGLVTVFPLPLPAGWSFDSYAEDGSIDFMFMNSGVTADPSFVWRVEGTLIAEVV